MDGAFCGVKHILRRMFRKITHRTETHMTETQENASRKETRRITISIGRINGGRIPRHAMPPHLRHLARENSLAQYLGPDGELVVTNSIRVTILSGDQLRDFLRENQSASYAATDFDPFTEASASCPIAEESFDSGLLKITTAWLMECSGV